MKRLIAVLLTVLMVASVCSVFSFAEDVNLVKNLDGGVTKFHANYTAKLTDGAAAEAVTFDNNWFSFYHNVVEETGEDVEATNAPKGVGTLVYDLGETCTINSARIHFGRNAGADAKTPKKITISVSDNGTSYTEFATKSPEVTTDGSWWEEFTGTARVGRYVKIQIESSSVHAFLNEVEVLGTKGATAPDPVSSDDTESSKVEESNSADESETESKTETSTDASAAPEASTATSSTTDASSTADASAAPETSTTNTSSTGTNTPVTGDAGVIVLVVLAVVAAFGSAVVVKARR